MGTAVRAVNESKSYDTGTLWTRSLTMGVDDRLLVHCRGGAVCGVAISPFNRTWTGMFSVTGSVTGGPLTHLVAAAETPGVFNRCPYPCAAKHDFFQRRRIQTTRQAGLIKPGG